MNQLTFIQDPLHRVTAYITTYGPLVLKVLAVLVIGALIAQVVYKFLSDVLKKAKIDTASTKIGLTRTLETGGIKRSVSELIAGIVAWIIVITTLVIALAYAGVDVFTLVDATGAYVPVALFAVVGLMVAMFVAGLLAAFVRVIAANTDMPAPDLLASITTWIIVGAAAIELLNRIGLGSILFTGTPLLIMIGSLGLALALAFGLGGRDRASRYIDKTLR
jgi:hypothetical protein